MKALTLKLSDSQFKKKKKGRRVLTDAKPKSSPSPHTQPAQEAKKEAALFVLQKKPLPSQREAPFCAVEHPTEKGTGHTL